ncbi:hypothetical protein L484_005137 [Morus notabilis]|uniref:Uncharacterized protein n=1 Tax=Morus notabilis TaxID=981085 RepID=W9R0Y6_9ROSA|nr:hypothetical protein L484_005137 [Morus notabilis]
MRDLGKSTGDRTTVAMGRLCGFFGFWGWELQRGIDLAREKWRYTCLGYRKMGISRAQKKNLFLTHEP